MAPDRAPTEQLVAEEHGGRDLREVTVIIIIIIIIMIITIIIIIIITITIVIITIIIIIIIVTGGISHPAFGAPGDWAQTREPEPLEGIFESRGRQWLWN